VSPSAGEHDGGVALTVRTTVGGRYRSYAGTALVVLVAAAWSLASNFYRFGVGDDGSQAVLVLHAIDPTLLAHDLIVTEVAPRYKSALFPLLATIARMTSVPFAYAIVFVVIRFALIAAYHRFCLAVTDDRRAAAWATILVTGFGFYGFGFYLGGIPLIEEKLVPRAAALPFALLSLASLLERRMLTATVAAIIAAVLHPVTGLAVLGIGAVNELFEYRGSGERFPIVVWSALVGAVGVLGIASGAFAGLAADGRVDGAWEEVVRATIGPFVYARQDMAWTGALFPAALVIGAVALFAAGTPRAYRAVLRFGTAALLGFLVQLIGVDGLGNHALLEANPARASFAIVACVGAALGLLVVQRLASSATADRVAACLLVVCILFRIDVRVTVPIAIACAALPALRRFVDRFLDTRHSAQAAAAIAAGSLILSLVLARDRLDVELGDWLTGRPIGWRAGHSYPPSFQGLRDLARLGLGNVSAIEVQRWIRGHSTLDAAILPPLSTPIGWQIHSERACVWNSSLGTFTHLSRSFALRYRVALEAVGSLREASWRALIEYGRAAGASFVVADVRVNPPAPDDPLPAFTAGPYAVLRVESGQKKQF